MRTTWPRLPFHAWRDTCETLHRYTQIVGKVRLALSPMTNHWWQVPLYLTARGLSTSPIPYGSRVFEVRFDFIAHQLIIETSDGQTDQLALAPRSVADFFTEFMSRLGDLGIDVEVWAVPVEVADKTPFADDLHHASYDRAYVERWFRILLATDAILKEFRSRFTGKCSPVHFYWGSFDLVVTRFSGRPSTAPYADAVTREAHAEEVSTAGFWPGNEKLGEAAFFSYAAPQPEGFRDAPVLPPAARFDEDLSLFILPYEKVRTSRSPRGDLLAFLQSTYEAAANLGRWDRAALERPLHAPQRGRQLSLPFDPHP